MTETWVAFDDGHAYDRYMGRWSRAIGEKFLAWLDPLANRHWLDVGCGTGAFTELVLARAAPEKIIGIDPSPAQIEHAKQTVTAPKVDFRAGTATELPFGTGEFDVVVSALALHFFPDRPKAFREMLRVTRSGGVVAGYTWRKSPTIIDAPYGPLARAVIEIAGNVMISPAVSEAMPEGLRATLTAEGYGEHRSHDARGEPDLPRFPGLLDLADRHVSASGREVGGRAERSRPRAVTRHVAHGAAGRGRRNDYLFLTCHRVQGAQAALRPSAREGCKQRRATSR
jgi:SAM-dependent methyltransferase